MIYLASQSPRRSELLQQIGVEFKTHPVDIDESLRPNESAEDYVKRLAIAKATACYQQTGDAPSLGSDTAVILGEQTLGKPRDKEDAISTLLSLAGQEHRVLTGVALVAESTDYLASESIVRFRPISRDEAETYWHTQEPCDKAGGYAVQGLGAIFIEHISGSYSGIMGLPVFETAQLLRAAAVPIWMRA